MTYFDLQTATVMLQAGQSPIDALGFAFGVPQCILDLGESAVMSLLPSGLVLDISDQVQAGRDLASQTVAELKRKLLIENGLFEIDTDNGTFIFKSDSFLGLLEADELQTIGNLGGLTSAVGAALQTGAEIYENYVDITQIFQEIDECFQSYETFLKANKSVSFQTQNQLGLTPSAAFAADLTKVQTAQSFIASADVILQDANRIINDRLNDPSLEPRFNPDLLPPGTSFLVGSGTSTSATPSDDPVFRLVFGPPKSTKGQFVLSVDGLYYDSQSGGLPVVSGYVAPETAYLLDYDANLGGKGQTVSTKDLDEYVDTIFDIDIVDESAQLQTHYDADHLLSVFESQKAKHISDLDLQLSSLYAQGYTDESAIVVGLHQSILATISIHDSKIIRRKKQIEVAVKAPGLFGSDDFFKPGEIPINDFSYLKNFNLAVALAAQDKLVFKQAEVSGVVLPLNPLFVTAQEAKGAPAMTHLVVPPVGKGGIIFDLSSTDTPSPAAVLSLNDLIVTDQLLAIYNFLESEVELSDSTEFNVLNCATSGNNYGNAQLVASSSQFAFPSGLAIPHLTGVSGNYVKLPDTKEFQDLTYGGNGFTFETWAYVPSATLDANWETSSYNRLLLACENDGGTASAADINKMVYNGGSETVRGMVIGFSRDRQVTRGMAPSDDDSFNPAGSGVFFIAPTQSVNTSDVTFVNANEGGCASSFEILKCAVDLSSTVNSVSIDAVSGSFVQLSVAVDPKQNEVRIVCNGQLMTTSSIESVFGVNPGSPPQLPSFYTTSSFEHTKGPKLNKFFTPWIIGGGYTDGKTDGFMGLHSGKTSGLKGHVGSVKFYSKALTTTESLKNYNAQKGLFENIEI